MQWKQSLWPAVSLYMSIVLCGTPPALAQDSLSRAALAVASYEASKDQCYYEDVVGKAIAKLDSFYGNSQPYDWGAAKREAAQSLNMLRNVSRMLQEGARNSPERQTIEQWQRNLPGGSGQTTGGTPDPAPKANSDDTAKQDDCKSLGLGISPGLAMGMMIVGFDPALMQEVDRLQKGDGRAK